MNECRIEQEDTVETQNLYNRKSITFAPFEKKIDVADFQTSSVFSLNPKNKRIEPKCIP